jgi:hypothetical protein
MKKNLKQSSLFNRLNKLDINISKYYLLYKIHQSLPVNEEHLSKLPADLFTNGSLTEKSIKLIESIDDLFIINKKIKIVDLMGVDYQENLDKYIMIFPTAKLPNGKYARSDKKNIETNFKWFFSNYEYDWNTILNATELYVNEYRANNFLYMRTAMYFIRKDDGTRNVLSELANYCDRFLKAGNYIEDKHFKTKVI